MRLSRMTKIAVLALLCVCYAVVSAQERPRLAVLTDIGGDPDDQQSLIRLMIYSNEFEIEALVASSSGTRGELKTAATRPELILQIIDAYAQVRPNLLSRWNRGLDAGRVSGNALRARKSSPRPRQTHRTAWFGALPKVELFRQRHCGDDRRCYPHARNQTGCGHHGTIATAELLRQCRDVDRQNAGATDHCDRNTAVSRQNATHG
ncbi:MAG: nucleoside hydrolase-like domain-containing protein [Pirellula sp.]